MSEQNEVIVAVQNSGVELTTAIALQNAFEGLFVKAQDWERIAKSIVVTDPTQLTEMKKARETRLELRAIRVEADKVRKKLKEDSLRYGKAVQGVYNVIEYFIAPLEEHLEKQEKYAENIEKERQEKLKNERAEILSQYAQYLPPFGDLGKMADFEFERLLDIGKEQEKKAKEEEEKRKKEEEKRKKEEEERISKEREERKRIEEENEKLRNEREELEKIARKEREELEKIARKEREELEKIARKEREERERIEREAREERAKKEQQEREEAEKIRKAQNAPDVEKLMTLALEIDGFKLPDVSSEESKKILSDVRALLDKVSNHIRSKAKNI